MSRPNVIFRIWLDRATRLARRTLLCPFGIHGPHSERGHPVNFCSGCSLMMRPEAFGQYTITLVDGSTLVVSAINEYHARMQVVYGDSAPLRANSLTGAILDPILIHPQNIARIERRPISQSLPVE